MDLVLYLHAVTKLHICTLFTQWDTSEKNETFLVAAFKNVIATRNYKF